MHGFAPLEVAVLEMAVLEVELAVQKVSVCEFVLLKVAAPETDAFEVDMLETAETVVVGVHVLDAPFVAVHLWFVHRAGQVNHSAAGQFVQEIYSAEEMIAVHT